jgi:hypothetical protein
VRASGDCSCAGADLEVAERLAARRRLQSKIDAVAVAALSRGTGPAMGAALEVLVRRGSVGDGDVASAEHVLPGEGGGRTSGNDGCSQQ